MPITVEVPNVGLIDFPDDFTEDQISKALAAEPWKQTGGTRAGAASMPSPPSASAPAVPPFVPSPDVISDEQAEREGISDYNAPNWAQQPIVPAAPIQKFIEQLPGQSLLKLHPQGREFLKTEAELASGFTSPEGLAIGAALAAVPEAALPAGIAFGGPTVVEGAKDILKGDIGAGIAKVLAGSGMVAGGVKGALRKQPTTEVPSAERLRTHEGPIQEGRIEQQSGETQSRPDLERGASVQPGGPIQPRTEAQVKPISPAVDSPVVAADPTAGYPAVGKSAVSAGAETRPAAAGEKQFPNKGVGSPADEFGAIYGPTLSKDQITKYGEQVGHEFAIDSPPGTQTILKVKPSMIWVETSRQLKDFGSAVEEEVGVAYLKIRSDGTTVLDASHHGRPIDKLAADQLMTFLKKSSPITPPPVAGKEVPAKGAQAGVAPEARPATPVAETAKDLAVASEKSGLGAGAATTPATEPLKVSAPPRPQFSIGDKVYRPAGDPFDIETVIRVSTDKRGNHWYQTTTASGRRRIQELAEIELRPIEAKPPPAEPAAETKGVAAKPDLGAYRQLIVEQQARIRRLESELPSRSREETESIQERIQDAKNRIMDLNVFIAKNTPKPEAPSTVETIRKASEMVGKPELERRARAILPDNPNEAAALSSAADLTVSGQWREPTLSASLISTKPRQPTKQIRLGKVGDMLSSGEQVLTTSGRKTSPFPKLQFGPRSTGTTINKVNAWLRENAIAEAESRGDEFNARIFRNENPKSIPPASKNAMEEYLFGAQPEIAPSVLKPIKPTPEPQRVTPEEGPKPTEPTGPGTGVGPGGTTPSDVGTKAELAQLTDSIATLAKQQRSSSSKAFDLGESYARWKDGVSDALVGLKAAAGYLKQRLTGKPVWTDFKSALGDRHLALSESSVNARKWAKSAEKAVRDPKLREAISNWIDAGGDLELLKKAEAETKPQYRAGYRRAQNLTPEEKLVAQNVRNYFDARLNDAIDAGILENGIEDYIHRTYESSSPWKQGILAELRSGLFTGKPAFAKQRVFEYDFEAEKAGYKPVKSFIKRVAAYDMSLNKAIADRKAVKDMMAIRMPDGRPMIDAGGIGIPVPKEGAAEATLIKPSFKPTDTENPLNNRSDFKAYDYPAFRKWKWASADANGNPIFVQGDVLVHPDAINQVKILFERSKVRQNPVGRAALGLSSAIKQTMLDISGFHLAQITVHGWEHRSFKPVKEIDFTNPDVRGLIRGGLQVGDTRGYELFSEGLAGSSLTKHIPGVGPKLQAWNEWLFQDYIPRLKVATGLHALERNRARFKTLSEDQLNHLTANQMNAAFGELNYEMLGRSKTTQDVLRLALLAPDFLEARGRFAAQAGTKYGKEQFQALALGAATLYITARIMNKLLNDEYHMEPQNMFSIVHNGRAYSLRTVQGDLLHLFAEPGRFFYNRLNPVYGRTGMEALTGRDVFGRKRDLGEQLKDFAQTPIPIAFRGFLNPDEQKVWESFINAFGITERRASSAREIYRQAEKYRTEKKLRPEPGEFIYDPEKDPYRSIRLRALYDGPNEVAEAIKKSVKDGTLTREQIRTHFQRYATHSFVGKKSEEPKFRAWLTADQRKIYDAAIAERRKVLNNVLAGLQK